MSQIYNIEEHPSVYFASKIKEIAKPLADYGVGFFSHRRLNKNGNIFVLNSNEELVRKMLEKGIFDLAPHSSNIDDFNNSYGLLITRDRDSAGEAFFDMANEYFHVDSAFCITLRRDDHVDIFTFAAEEANPAILNFFLNHTKLLRKFISDYYQKADKIIEVAAKNGIQHIKSSDHMIKYPMYQIGSQSSETGKSGLLDMGMESIGEFIFNRDGEATPDADTGSRRGRNLKVGEVTLTSREVDCLKWLVEGKSAIETSEILGISKRTVENHIARVKIKFNVRKKSELVVKLIEAKIFTESQSELAALSKEAVS